jgi:hypothetical protein
MFLSEAEKADAEKNSSSSPHEWMVSSGPHTMKASGTSNTGVLVTGDVPVEGCSGCTSGCALGSTVNGGLDGGA